MGTVILYKCYVTKTAKGSPPFYTYSYEPFSSNERWLEGEDDGGKEYFLPGGTCGDKCFYRDDRLLLLGGVHPESGLPRLDWASSMKITPTDFVLLPVRKKD